MNERLLAHEWFLLTSSAHTSDDTSDQNEVGALTSSLQGTADNSEYGCKKKTVDSANAVGRPTADEASDNGTKVVLW